MLFPSLFDDFTKPLRRLLKPLRRLKEDIETTFFSFSKHWVLQVSLK
jgi:hypothetical protein